MPESVDMDGMDMDERNIAVVLAAGQGRRMQTKQKKQYLLLENKPMLYYSLQTFERSECITDVIIVVGTDEETYVQSKIVDRFQFSKVRMIVEGGKERYHSVYNGLQAITEFLFDTEYKCYIWIHDGARPFIGENILRRALDGVRKEKACVVGMPAKDTIKIADENDYIKTTPNRNSVWMIQTPQVFEYGLINLAYTRLMKEEDTLAAKGITVTDDAMVLETFTNKKVKLVEGDYKNIKITTPEDLQIAQVFQKNQA